MVGFYISGIKVENFRCLKNFDLEIPSDRPLVLIGPNNAGKTTLIDAFGIGGYSAKFYKYSLCEEDFWMNTKNEKADTFIIDLSLQAYENKQLPSVKPGLGDPIYVHGIRTVGHIKTLEVERFLLNESGEIISINRGTPISQIKKAIYEGQGFGGRRYARLFDIDKWMPELWQLDPKSLFLSLYEWKTGPLQRVLKKYKEMLFTEEWETSTKHKMPKVLIDAHGFLNNIALKTPYWSETLSPAFNKKFKEYMGVRTNIEILPGLKPIEAWLLSVFMLSIKTDLTSPNMDSKKLGDGWQSLLRLVALDVALTLPDNEKSALLLVEEPETYLHPHLRRKLRKIFKKFQDSKNQVIVSTHSEELISFSEKQKIVRLTASSEGTVKHEYVGGNTSQALKYEEKLYEKGNHEIVFANKVILTEGKGDRFAVSIGLEKLSIDIDAESVSVIDCGGVKNLYGYAEICSNLGIPWLAVHDKDMLEDGTQNSITAGVRNKLEGLKTEMDTIEAWDNDLEDVIGFREQFPFTDYPNSKVDAEWINTEYFNIQWSNLNTQVSLKKYCKAIKKIEAWLKSS